MQAVRLGRSKRTVPVVSFQWRCTILNAFPIWLCGLRRFCAGVLQQTSEGGWAHVVCALWDLRTYFKDGEDGIERIHGVQDAKLACLNQHESCYLCGDDSGVRLQCSHSKCTKLMHPMCALSKSLHINVQEKNQRTTYTCFCEVSVCRAVPGQQSNLFVSGTRRAARCSNNSQTDC